jgi:DNA polymerase delta subunit 1
MPRVWNSVKSLGIETVRRDSCRLVAYVIETCLQKLLIERDTAGAEEYSIECLTLSDL